MLEAKLTELSITVGDYDRHRNSDQHSIQLLKDQIAELETRAHVIPMDYNSEKQDKSSKLNEKTNLRDDLQSDLHGKIKRHKVR